jgi:exonuclease III
LDSVINNVACGFRAGAYNVGQAFGSKIEKILMRANQLSLDFLALSEIGDPKVNDRLIHSYGYRFLTCPKAHAGVMLLFRSAFAPHLRRPLDTGKDGRLVGGHFEIAGQTILLVSAYVQTGVDRMSAESTEFKEVEALYARIQRWTADHSVSRVVVLGDLNETCSARDRDVVLPGSSSFRCISSLIDNGFIDCYRSLHSHRGFTCKTPVAGRDALSRLDYIMANGFGVAPVRSCTVDDYLVLSRHSLIWADVASATP